MREDDIKYIICYFEQVGKRRDFLLKGVLFYIRNMFIDNNINILLNILYKYFHYTYA
jgi:hypothetical protein